MRVLVLGGGVSGLATAGGLARSGWGVTLLEAKDRLGGRILTQHLDRVIVEMGAEFVHGRGEAMIGAVREAGLRLADVSEQNRLCKGGALREVELWEKVGKALGKIDSRGKDVSFADWLARSDLDAEARQMALGFVAGFNASDARLIGAHGLLRAEYSSEHDQGDKQARVVQGYGALVEKMRQSAEEAGVEIRLNTRAHLVKWERGRVEAKADSGDSFEADAAVITLPLGVLKSGRVVFEPSLVHKREAIEQMQFGNVARLVFVFRTAWWTAAAGSAPRLEKDFGFVHAFDEAIPTWWSDSRAPVIIGWAAGPKGETMLNLGETELKRRGLAILARIFQRDLSAIEKDLVSIEFHDWRSDSDIGGAYSYLPVNGLDLPKELAAPVENTLFFAGEATAMDAQMGTVSGAIESAARVLKEIAAAKNVRAPDFANAGHE